MAVLVMGDGGALAGACAARLRAQRSLETVLDLTSGGRSDVASEMTSVLRQAVTEHGPLRALIWIVDPGPLAVGDAPTAALDGALLAARSLVDGDGMQVVIVLAHRGPAESSWPDPAAAAQGGVIGAARVAARALGPSGITVNVVRSGLLAHPVVEPNAADTDAAATGRRSRVRDRAEIGRPVHPDEVAAAVTYLASDQARFVTGTVLPVDAGATIGSGPLG